MAAKFPKITLWRVIAAVVFVSGGYATYSRFLQGLAASTNLSDQMPWGIWVAFGTLCGVGLSAGGFAIVAAVYLLGMERYRPVVRASVLISFLGYMTVIFGMLYELGLPWRFWHPLLFWNTNSVLFDVAMCVMTYSTVLTLEFFPVVIEKIPWQGPREFILHWHHRLTIALVLAGVLLSSMHQSFLGGLFLISRGKLYPLWYSQNIHALFFMSAIAAGLAVTVMAMYLCIRSMNAQIDYGILRDLARVASLMLVVYAFFRGLDLVRNGGAAYLFRPVRETGYFWLEIVLLVAIPVILLQIRKVLDTPLYLYWACSSVVAGFIINRLNVCITGFERSMGVLYTPKWTEMASTIALVAAGVVVFRFAVEKLDVLPKRIVRPRQWMAEGGAPVA